MIKRLKTNTPLVVAFSVLFVLAAGLEIFLSSDLERVDFFEWYSSSLRMIEENKFLDYGLTVILLLVIGYTTNRAFNKTSFYRKTTSFPIFIFLTVLSTFGGFYFETSYVIDLIFSLVFIKLMDLDQNKSAIHISFKSGILIGIAFLFSYWVIPVGILIFFSLNVFRPFYWREWLVNILGIGLPVIYLLSFRYLLYNKYNFSPRTVSSAVKINYWYDYLSYSLLTLIVFFAIIKLRKHLTYTSNIERKQINILVFFTILSFTISTSIFLVYSIEYLIFIVPLTLLIVIPILNSSQDRLMNFLLGTLVVLNLFRIFIF